MSGGPIRTGRPRSAASRTAGHTLISSMRGPGSTVRLLSEPARAPFCQTMLLAIEHLWSLFRATRTRVSDRSQVDDASRQRSGRGRAA